ncbi:hypothetical protein MUK42_19813, partial [Musa troglodytarum]
MEGASCRPVRWRRCRESWVDPMEEEINVAINGVLSTKTAKLQLLEICIANCWNPPSFILSKEEGSDHQKRQWRLKRDAFITSSCSTENEPPIMKKNWKFRSLETSEIKCEEAEIKNTCCCHRSRESQIEPGSSLNSSNRTKRGLLLCPSVRRSSSNTTNPQAPSAHLLPTLDLEFDLRRANARFGN